ncbi:DUF5753 domain-containing protein [Streptomyces sp. PsTaAH-124]|uniref:DUF5753 domain-containing protein n=1 Tax=Streptomyces sp. PsTaAH-124 TaxID=1157638 RepID=UPI00038127B7|nr:DUF5753 domain-containing protein [Streptomyces sp. PsTaAH-124]
MTSAVPWQQRLSTGTEDIQDEVIHWYRQSAHAKAYVPHMIWGTLQTEAYASVILRRVVDFLGVPDDVRAGVAKRMERQKVLYDGEHHYDVILGEQALYTNVGGAEVMREQVKRILGEIDLPSLDLGIVPRSVEVGIVPTSGFHVYDDQRAHYELVSSAVDVTDPAEIALHVKAFEALRAAASYGAGAREILREALDFWTTA